MTTASASYEKLLGRHLELRRTVARLRDHLRALDSRPSGEAIRTWAPRVADELVELQETLASHFGEEESSRLLQDLAAVFPQHARRLEKLSAEHEELLADGRQLTTAFMDLARRSRGSAPELAHEALDLLERLLRHEDEETSLMQRAYTEDLGTP